MKTAIPLTVLAAAVGTQAARSGPQPSSFRDALTHSIMEDLTDEVAASSAVAGAQSTPEPSTGSHHSPPLYPHAQEGRPHEGPHGGPPRHPPMAQAERRAFRPDGQGVDEGNTVTSPSNEGEEDQDDKKEENEHKPMGDSAPTCSTLTEVKTVTQTVTGAPHHHATSAAHSAMVPMTSSAAHVAETPASTHAFMMQAAPSSTQAVHSQLISNQTPSSAAAHSAMVSSSGVVMGPASAYSVIPVHVPMASSSHSSIKLHGSNSAATPSSSAGPSGADPNRAHGTMAATPSSMSFTGAGAQVAPNAAIMTAFGGFMGIVAFVL